MVWIQGPADATSLHMRNADVYAVLLRKPIVLMSRRRSGSRKDEVWAAKCVVGVEGKKLSFGARCHTRSSLLLSSTTPNNGQKFASCLGQEPLALCRQVRDDDEQWACRGE